MTSAPAKGRKPVYPFREMEVGTAFICPKEHPGCESNNGRFKIEMAARSYATAHKIKLSCIPQLDGSIRVERKA